MASQACRKSSGRKPAGRGRPSKPKRRIYTVMLEAEQDPEFKGCYSVRVPALPGCLTYGVTKAEAMRNAKEAITGYSEMLAKERM